MKLRIPIFICGLLVAFNASSQDAYKEPWTLKKCIEHASENSFASRSGVLNVENSKLNYQQSRLNLLPTLNGSGSHNYSQGTTIDPITNGYIQEQIQSNSFGLRAGLNVFNGFQNMNSMKQQKFSYLASQKELEVTLNTVSLTISNLYLQIIQNKEVVKVATEQVNSTQLQVENMQKMIDAGSRPEGDIFQVKAQLSNDKLTLQNAENGLENALLNLKNTLYLDANTPFDVAVPTTDYLNSVVVDSNSNILGLYEQTMQSRPDVQAAELRNKSSEYQLKTAKGTFSPSLSFYANWNTRYSEKGLAPVNPRLQTIQIGEVDGTNQTVSTSRTFYDYEKVAFGQQLDDNLGRSVGLSLNVPLFNGLRNHTAVKQAKVNLEQSKLQLQEQKNKYLADLTLAYTNYLSSTRKLESSKENLDAQQLNFEYSNKRYEAGALDFTNFSIAQNNLNIARAQFIQAKYEYVFTGLVLNFYKGLPIEL